MVKTCETLVLFVKVEDPLRDFVELFSSKFGVNGKAEDSTSEILGDREISGTMAHFAADRH